VNWDNYYDILGVDSRATSSDIKRAYAARIRKYTNEQFPDEFMKIRQAYEVLIDDQSRREYDTELLNQSQYTELLNEARRNVNNGNLENAKVNLRRLQELFPDDRVVLLELEHIRNAMRSDSNSSMPDESKSNNSSSDDGGTNNWGCCICIIIIALIYLFNQ